MALRLVIAAALTLFGWQSVALAAEAPLPVRLDFRSDEGCPSQREFEDKVNARTPVSIGAPSPALTLEVGLSHGPREASGRLRAASLAGSDAREVSGATCGDVADALALIASLMIERTQREQEARAAEAAPRPVIAPAQSMSPIPNPAPRSRAMVMLGLGAGVMWATTDAPLAGAGLSLWVEKGLTWSLAASYATNQIAGEPERVRFVMGALTATAGSPSLQVGPMQLSAAVAAKAGFLSAEGFDVDVAYSVRRSYFAVGAAGRAQLRLASPLFAFAELGGLVPLTVRRFSVRDPESVVAETTTIAFETALGLALRL